MQARRAAPLVVIFGALARKDWATTLQAIAPTAHTIIATPLADGGAPVSEIAAYAKSLGARARAAPSLAEAIEQAGQFPAPRILICGSLALVGEALALGEERGA